MQGTTHLLKFDSRKSSISRGVPCSSPSPLIGGSVLLKED